VFFGLAFALTWCTVPMGGFMAAGPLLAALVVIGVVDGRAGLRELGARMIKWRVGWQWYVAAIAIPLGLVVTAGGLNVAFGASDAALARLEVSALVMTFALRLVVPVFAPMGEEPGWRGFALPRLQASRSPLQATLILGLLVTAWHVPLVFMTAEHLDPVLLLASFAVTFYYTWLFNRTGGSVFITIVAHATEGAVVGALRAKPDGFHGADATRFAVLYTVGWCIVAIAVVVLDRKAWRAQSGDTVDPPVRVGVPVG
jgi:membrane protease YdiL (CAAX protease family)